MRIRGEAVWAGLGVTEWSVIPCDVSVTADVLGQGLLPGLREHRRERGEQYRGADHCIEQGSLSPVWCQLCGSVSPPHQDGLSLERMAIFSRRL